MTYLSQDRFTAWHLTGRSPRQRSKLQKGKSKYYLYVYILKLRNHLLTHVIQTRITVALILNADGADKLHPFSIDRANKPRCFN